MKLNSKTALFLSIVILSISHLYYPKWQKSNTEATISWDVSGYYMYLPAFFIYKDIKQCRFKDEVIQQYKPTFDFHQAFIHPSSGNHVMKYSIGQAVQFSPFFFIAHVWALSSDTYEADGFSFPYQFMISIGSLLIAFLGLYYLRKILCSYFNEQASALAMLGIVLGSNYLNYSAIDGAMTHNNLFTIYTLLIYLSIQFHKQASITKSIGIGCLIGLAALTRPTEIISCIIPLLWGLNLADKQAIIERINFFKQHISHLFIAIIICGLIGSIQLFYWKYASGDFIVYSYQDQGFSWLSPHIIDATFSYKSGWLMYSPFMLFSLIGFYFLHQQNKRIFYVSLIFATLFIYIAFAWDIWWYGGSLGQRTMVQAYPILAFPLAAFFTFLQKSKALIKVPIALLMFIFIYLNIWFTHQAHKGGLLYPGEMTKAYYWKTLGRFEKNSEHLKLIDQGEIYEARRNNVQLIFEDSSRLIQLNKEVQKSPVIKTQWDKNADWIRVYADVSIGLKEWDMWKMTRLIVSLKNGDTTVKENSIRLQRHLLHDGLSKQLYLDVSIPDTPFTDIEVRFWNGDGSKNIDIKNIKIESFNE